MGINLELWGSVSSGTRKKSFTLIELLVVISIIAILASMLLPVLNRARMVAHSTECMSRLKTLGVSFANYESTYNRPHYASDDREMNAYYYNTEMLPYTGNRNRWNKKFYRQISCPAVREALETTYYYVSYGYLQSIYSKSNLAMNRFRTPSATAQLVERFNSATYYAYPYKDNAYSYLPYEGVTAYRHKNGLNVLFMDKHVKRLYIKELPAYDRATSATDTRYRNFWFIGQ